MSNVHISAVMIGSFIPLFIMVLFEHFVLKQPYNVPKFLVYWFFATLIAVALVWFLNKQPGQIIQF